MLNVRIYSFGYKKSGIPEDISENGGGFVFDCRYIYNPGREEKFKLLHGKHSDLIEFLGKDEKMQRFLQNVYSLADEAIENYLSRQFTSIMFSFGCTGGQHRSVYAAECLMKHLKEKYNSKINISVKHMEYPELSN